MTKVRYRYALVEFQYLGADILGEASFRSKV